MKKIFSLLYPVLIILPIFLYVARPALHDGLFHVDDNVQVTRTMAVHNELVSGQFPVRFLGTFGYGAGYFLLKYYSPVVYYLGAFLHMGGLSFIQAVKVVNLIFLFGGTLGMWVLLKSMTSRLSATLGTIAFLLAPYVFHDFFHRGSLTEASAMMIIPWMIWAYLLLTRKRSRLYIALSASFLGLTLLTHLLVGMMAIALIISLTLVMRDGRKVWAESLIVIILGIGLSAFTFLPALIDKNLVGYTGNSLVARGYIDHPVRFWDNLIPTAYTGLPSFLGIPLFIGYFALLTTYSLSREFRKKYGVLPIWIMLVMTVCFYIMSPASAWMWERWESLRYIQFPFRFLTTITIVGSLGYSLLIEHMRKSLFVVVVLIGLVLVQPAVYPQFYQPLGYQYGTDYKVEDPCMTTGWANEHLPRWVTKCITKPISLVTPLEGSVVVHEAKDLVNGRVVKFSSSGEGDVQIAKYYFPNWQARVGSDTDAEVQPYGEHGLIKLHVTGANTEVSLHYLQSPLELASNWITVGSLVGILALSLSSLHRRSR